jgi:UDP-N-acetylglucosamine--N-acetylmuramyl-(pentapeptide) pyrophosphoryl-undecaprenol N-acetylglucosamine transferase
MAKTVVLAGGGTGGHVYPALAIGEALEKRGHRLAYFGDPNRLEGRVVPERGVPFQAIPALQYPRAGLLSKIRFAFGLLSAVLACRGLLRKHGADFVLGVGGYISAPPVLAAWTLGIPRAVHEANATPGLANKLCARVADVVFLAYERARSRLPGSAPKELGGCPVSPAIAEGRAAAAAVRYHLEAKPTVLVVGGSLGAETINRLGKALALHPARTFQLVWVVGPRYEEEIRADLGPPPSGVAVVGYENRMPDAYALSALVVCRAGSSTLAELTILGKPSVLVPSPNVTENHQEENARALEESGAALVFVESTMDVDAVAGAIVALFADHERLAAMGAAARSLGHADTAEKVAASVDERFLR